MDLSAQSTSPQPGAAGEFLRGAALLAAARGKELDLSDCYYGAPHWNGEFISSPSPYYFFLAGLCRALNWRNIFEIGTHYGGSIRAMMRGIAPAARLHAKLITADITSFNREAFLTAPDDLITRLEGDAVDSAMSQHVVELFGGDVVDAVYIDAKHTYESTAAQINLYLPLLKPRFLVLDDIHLNPSMERLWVELSELLGDRAFDATMLSDRGPSGFGLCLLD